MSREKASTIPDYLSAGTPKGLRRLMLLNNAKRGCWHKYDIMYVEKENRWYAWYQKAVLTTEESFIVEKDLSSEVGDV